MQSPPGAYCHIRKDHNLHVIRFIKVIRGSIQKFCALYVFSLKMNLFYKIHIRSFNVISVVLYHSGPTFGHVPCSCQDAFVVDASDYSLDAPSMLQKRFKLNGFFNFGNKSKAGGLMSGLYGGWGSTCHPYLTEISDTAPERHEAAHVNV